MARTPSIPRNARTCWSRIQSPKARPTRASTSANRTTWSCAATTPNTTSTATKSRTREHVDVYDNVAAHNAGGIGVFNLPDLPKQGGQHVRVFRNQVYENNTPNFAPKSLGPIYFLPTGTGVYIMAIHDVEEFQNKIRDNNTTNVFMMAYDSTLPDPTTGQPGIHDARFRPYTDHIYLHDNEISGGGKIPGHSARNHQGCDPGGRRLAAGYSLRRRRRSRDQEGRQGRESRPDLHDQAMARRHS